MTQEEIMNYFNVSESYLRTNFPKFCQKQLKQGFLITKRGKYPNAIYEIEKVTPKEVERQEFSRIKIDTQELPGEQWIQCYEHPNYEVSNLGRIRNKENKRILQGCLEKDGYVQQSIDGKNYFLHRIILQSFNPIDNWESMTVDHINGIKSDNKLENLRWATANENILFMMQNRAELNKELTRIIQKYGYLETLKKLQQII